MRARVRSNLVRKGTEGPPIIILFQPNTPGETLSFTIKGIGYITLDWGDGIEMIQLTGNYQDITHTYSLAGAYSVNIKGVRKVSAFVLANNISVKSIDPLGFIGIQEFHVTCCGLTQNSIDLILTTFKNTSKYTLLTTVDVTCTITPTPPSTQVWAEFKIARPTVILTTDPVPYFAKFTIPSDAYTTQNLTLAGIAGDTGKTIYLWYDPNDAVVTVNISGTLERNSNWIYPYGGEITYLYAWGDLERISKNSFIGDTAIEELNVTGFAHASEINFSQNNLSSASILSIVQELSVAANFPDLVYVDVSFQLSGGGISQVDYDAFTALRPTVNLIVDII